MSVAENFLCVKVDGVTQAVIHSLTHRREEGGKRVSNLQFFVITMNNDTFRSVRPFDRLYALNALGPSVVSPLRTDC